MGVAAGAECVSNGSLGHHPSPSQLVGQDKCHQVQAAEEWPRGQDGMGSGQGEGLHCPTPPFFCIPLWGHNPRTKLPGSGVSWLPPEHFSLGGTEGRDQRMVGGAAGSCWLRPRQCPPVSVPKPSLRAALGPASRSPVSPRAGAGHGGGFLVKPFGSGTAGGILRAPIALHNQLTADGTKLALGCVRSPLCCPRGALKVP